MFFHMKLQFISIFITSLDQEAQNNFANFRGQLSSFLVLYVFSCIRSHDLTIYFSYKLEDEEINVMRILITLENVSNEKAL